MTVSPPFNINQLLPGDSDIVSQHPGNARTFRDVVESWILTGHDTNGQHLPVYIPRTATPTTPAAAIDVLYTTTRGRLKIKHPDGTEEFVGVPPGNTGFSAANSAPVGWLYANGALVSRSTYADLFDAIGTTYGAGDTVTTFGLPDLRGRGLVGIDDSAGRISTATMNSVAIGGVGGGETSALVVTNIPTLTVIVSSVTGSATISSVSVSGSASLSVTGTYTGTATGTISGQTVSGTVTVSGQTASGNWGPFTTGTESADHTHTQQGTFTSGAVSADHTHTQTGTFTSGTMSANASHVHSGHVADSGLASPDVPVGSSTSYNIAGNTNATNTDHTHNVTISGQTGGISANHSHNVVLSGATTGKSATHTHSISGSITGAAVTTVTPSLASGAASTASLSSGASSGSITGTASGTVSSTGTGSGTFSGSGSGTVTGSGSATGAAFTNMQPSIVQYPIIKT